MKIAIFLVSCPTQAPEKHREVLFVTKETKIGLLVGLAFIILFAIILSEKGPTHRNGATTPNFTVVDASNKNAGPPSPAGQPLREAGKLPVEQLGPIVRAGSKFTPPVPMKMQEEKVADVGRDEEPIEQLPDTLTALVKSKPDHLEIVKPGSPPPSEPKVEIARHEVPVRSAPTKTEIAKIPLSKSEPTDDAGNLAIENEKDAQGEKLASKDSHKDDASAKTKEVNFPIKTEHVVQSGESLGKIAAKYYGRSTPARVDAIYKSNRDTLSSPQAVKVGEKLKIPDLGEHADKFEPAPGFVLSEMNNPQKPARDAMLKIPAPVSEEKTAVADRSKKSEAKKSVQTIADKTDKSAFEWYEVRKGDTLSKIARKELGNEKYVHEISKLNKLSDKKNLKVGSKIRLPSKTALSGESTAAITSRGPDNAEP